MNWRSLLASASLVALSACGNHVTPTEKDVQNIAELTQNMQTHCIGRYQIDLPKGFELDRTPSDPDNITSEDNALKPSISPTMGFIYGNDKIEDDPKLHIVQTHMSEKEFEDAALARIEKIKNIKGYLDKLPAFGGVEKIGDGYLITVLETGTGNKFFNYLFLGFRNGTYFDIYIDAIATEKSNDYPKAEIIKKQERAYSRLTTLIQSTRAFDDPANAGKGFCMDHLIVNLPADDERMNGRFVHPQRNDLSFDLEVAANQDNDTDDIFKRTSKGFALAEEQTKTKIIYKTIVKKDENFNHMRLLQSGISSDIDGGGKFFSFQLETRRDQGSIDKPLIHFVMKTNKETPQSFVPSKFTEGEAVALWETIVKTLRPRPNAF